MNWVSTFMKNSFILFAASFCNLACTQSYDVHTNLDPENFKQYYKPSQVVLYESDQLPIGTKSIAAITGQSCQIASLDKPANLAEARTEARIAAANLGANGLVIDICETEQNTESPKCITLMSCYGRALKTPKDKP